MPAPGCSTFDGNPNLPIPTTQGYRPGQDDFDGAEFEDLGSAPPNPRYIPSAGLTNTEGWQLISVSRMIPWGACDVAAGVGPTITNWRVAANNVTANPFTVVRNSVGNYSITTAAGVFPAPVGNPRATITAILGAHSYSIGVVNIANGVQVTTTIDGALADISFGVDFF
jgi:hypothetical protein